MHYSTKGGPELIRGEADPGKFAHKNLFDRNQNQSNLSSQL